MACAPELRSRPTEIDVLPDRLTVLAQPIANVMLPSLTTTLMLPEDSPSHGHSQVKTLPGGVSKQALWWYTGSRISRGSERSWCL
jgi:hypothetical protein